MSKMDDIAKDYLVDKDMTIIEAWAKKKECIGISFRPAGEKTLKCLRRGAGAKPHEILDKTLKRKNGDSQRTIEHNGLIDKFFDGFDPKIDEAKDLLEGLVGHWTKSQVDGVYLTSIGYDEFKKAGGFDFGTNEKNMPYLVLESKEQKTKLISYFEGLAKDEKQKAYYLFTRCFFSGDYDVHDLLWDRWQVPTLMDMKLLKDLQTALITGRKEQLIADYGLTQEDLKNESKYDHEYCRVQHGPQYNYTAQMLNENNKHMGVGEKNNKHVDVRKINLLVESVINIDPPVAVYDNCVLKGEWDILANTSEVEDYYQKYGRTVKETWGSKEGRERFIRNNIKRIVRLCFPDAGRGTKVTPKMLLEQVPQLKEVYGNDYETYADAALKEL